MLDKFWRLTVCCNCVFCNLIGLQNICNVTRPSHYAWVWLRPTISQTQKEKMSVDTRSLESHNKTSDLPTFIRSSRCCSLSYCKQQGCSEGLGPRVFIFTERRWTTVFCTYMMVLFTFFEGFNFSTHTKKER